ncbi:MAG: hypothetical protein IT320_26580 [Anaerolineae bacterium]|nr:hypothetical protein [Anaerolineae bacterium]
MHMHHRGPRGPMMFGPRMGFGHRPWGFFPLLPILFGVFFFLFILPHLFALLPFVIVAGAVWYMTSPRARQWAEDTRQKVSEDWAEKPKRDFYDVEDKPKRGDAEYV